ncbi:phage baseplate assembly protein V [Acidovorax sp. BL-A-41-H1]|uniref:phage baseplate assembly protein V n=1 Tax=Acidovorax sp. BL-A-41-H1 TaxID=3421102 RepID=UPI003F79C306
MRIRVRFRARAGTIVRMERPVSQSESPLEIGRRIENILRAGTVAEVRHGKPARCRVRSGELLTDWLPWTSGSAGGPSRRQWWPPKVGEQCMVMAPGGDLLNAVVLPGVYSDKAPQGSENPDAYRLDWSATEGMEHDAGTGMLTITCEQAITLRVGQASIELRRDRIVLSAGGGSLVIDGDGATGSPDVLSGGISLRSVGLECTIANTRI